MTDLVAFLRENVTMLENLKLNSFSEHLGTRFRVYGGEDTSVEMELVEAVDRGSNAKQERFALLFRGPLDAAVDQGTYKVAHDKLGSFDLFLVPIRISESGREYEAVFNRIVR
jgi:hypothetical protein